MNQGVHTVDLLVAALGQPVEVFAYTGTLAHERIETEDVAVGVVKFANGALGVLHGSTAAYPGLSARLQVHGDRGSVVIENDELTFVHLTPTGTEPEEKLMGSIGKEINEAEQYRQAGDRTATPGAIRVSCPMRTATSTRTSWRRFAARPRSGSGWPRTGSRSA